METIRRNDDAPAPGAEGDDESPPGVTVTVHSTCKDRVVFTETDNSDGWIATDLAVDLSR